MKPAIRLLVRQMMRILLCVVLCLHAAVLFAADPTAAFDGFKEKLIGQGYRSLDDSRHSRSGSYFLMLNRKESLFWSCNLDKDGRKIKVLAFINKNSGAAYRAIEIRRRGTSGYYHEVKGLKPGGLSFYTVARPYNFVTDIVTGRIHVEYHQSEKDPGGTLLGGGATKNKEVRRLLTTLALDLKERAEKANRILAGN